MRRKFVGNALDNVIDTTVLSRAFQHNQSSALLLDQICAPRVGIPGLREASFLERASLANSRSAFRATGRKCEDDVAHLAEYS